MKIFYISVIELHKGWGSEYFINKGFLKLGHETITLDYRKYRNRLGKEFLEIPNFDVIFLQRGERFPTELIKSINRPRFYFASELVQRRKDQDHLLKSGLFNHIFVHSNKCKEIILNRKWITEDRISVLLSGFDEDVHFKIPNIKKDIDVLFVGSITNRRREILDNLKKDFNLYEARAYGMEMTKLFNRAKIVLNIHAEDYLDTENRIYEALGCSSFIIKKKLSSENPFKTGVHLIESQNLDEMKDQIVHFLHNEDERKKISDEGYKEAISKHTYTKRAEEILKIMNKYKINFSIPAISNMKVKLFILLKPFIQLKYMR